MKSWTKASSDLVRVELSNQDQFEPIYSCSRVVFWNLIDQIDHLDPFFDPYEPIYVKPQVNYN